VLPVKIMRRAKCRSRSLAYIAPRVFNAGRKNMREVLVGFYSVVTKIGFYDDIGQYNNNE